MQQKISPSSNDFLVLVFHSTYTTIEVALYNNGTLVRIEKQDHKAASTSLITSLNLVLDGLPLSACHFVAAHQGPGPFTTLRVLLATVNGLAFTSKLPLIGVNGLNALLSEQQTTARYRAALLNAFCDDVYMATHDAQKGTTHFECFSYHEAIHHLKGLKESGTLHLVGNALTVYQEDFEREFPEETRRGLLLPATCTIDTIACMAHHEWRERSETVSQLMPLYLKASSAKLNKQSQS